MGMQAHAAPRQTQGAHSGSVAAVTEVILLRGLFNVFSLGMDDLGKKLEAKRVVVKVSGHGSWSSLADDIIARRRAGEPPRRLVLIGHSLGANDVIAMAEELGRAGISVDLLIPIDPTAPSPIPSNVRRVVNYYQSNNGFGISVVAGRDFRGSLSNADVAGSRRDLASSDMSHTTIDKSGRIHREIAGLVAGLTSARAARSRRPAM
ncbi:MAG: hypothetical protein ACRCUE_18110 [Bosea sp. (in: a-proteobacteria)]